MGFFDFLRENEEQPVDQPLPTALSKPVEQDQAPSTGIQDPTVRDYISKLYGDKFSDSARANLQNQIKTDSSGPNFKAGLAALGAGLAGHNASAAGEAVLDRQKAEREKKLTDFDTGRKNIIAQNELNRGLRDDARSQELVARETDPNSQESKLAQNLAIKWGVSPDLASKMTAQTFKQQGPLYEKAYSVEQAALARKDSLKEHHDDFLLKSEELKALRDNKNDEKMHSLQTPYGLANTTDDAKQLKDASEAKKSFDQKLDQLIALREKHGGGAVFNRDDVAKGKELSSQLLNEYRNLSKMRMLNEFNEGVIDKIIPQDPLQFNSPLAAVQGEDPTLNTLKSFKADSEKDFNNRIATRTRSGMSGLQNQSSSNTPPETKSVGGKTYKKVAGGWQLIKDSAVADSGGIPSGQ